MTFPRPRDYPRAWILGALLLLASEIAFVACGDGSGSATDQVVTATACACPASACQCSAPVPFAPSIVRLELEPGWAAGSGDDALGYWLDPFRVVHLVGWAAWRTGAGLTIAVLPAGARPKVTRIFGVPGVDNVGQPMTVSVISPNGEIRLMSPPSQVPDPNGGLSSTVYSLDGITFLAEQ